jgi:hypothetical protein
MHADAGETSSADGRELNLSHSLCNSRIRVACKEVVRSEVAEVHPNQLETDRSRIRGHDKSPYKAPLQPTVGESQEDMQEHHRRYQIDGLTNRERDVARRPDERRDEVHKACGDH